MSGGSWLRLGFMTTAMACPRSRRRDLTTGVIVGRSPWVEFKRSRGVSGGLTGIPVTTGFFNHSVPAFRCDDCGTVVVILGR